MPRVSTGSCLYVLFFLSGLTCLLYEVAWIRLITLQIGGTTIAVSTTVTAFMGGLALGAWLVSLLRDRVHRPVFLYGWLELGISLFALMSSWLVPSWMSWLDHFGIQSGVFSMMVRSLWASLLLLLPCMAMGATLPLLAYALPGEANDREKGTVVLYTINAIGAFCGVVLAGYILLPLVGTMRALVMAACLNFLVGVGAIFLSRWKEKRVRLEDRSLEEYRLAIPPPWLCWVVGLVGFGAMACQVIWTRIVVLVVGGSVFAYTTVIATVLLGIGLGGLLLRWWLKKSGRSSPLYELLILTVLSLWLSLGLASHLPAIFLSVLGEDRSAVRPIFLVGLKFTVTALVLLLPAMSLSACFSCSIARWQRKGAVSDVGLLYAWNTVGGIVGSFAGAFVLLPSLNVIGAIYLVIGVLMAAALMTLAARELGRRWLKWRIVIGLLTCVIVGCFRPSWHNHLMVSGPYKYSETYLARSTSELVEEVSKVEKLVYYRDGKAATVSVAMSRNAAQPELYLSVNGKMDGSSYSDLPTQRLSAHVPMVIHPNPREVCVIGMGTGCSAGSVALHEVRAVEVVEIEPAVVEAATLFGHVNHRVHENPKVRIRIGDGRAYLKGCQGAFDVIISEPSNPWQAGSSDLFTRSYYQRCSKALKKGGLMCQWMQIYGLKPDSVRILLKTYRSVFPHVLVFMSLEYADLLVLGSQSEVFLDLPSIRERLALPLIATDLSSSAVGIDSVEDFFARFRLGPEAVEKLIGQDLPLHTDDRPIIAYRGPFELYADTREENERLLRGVARGVVPLIESGHLLGYDRSFVEGLSEAYRAYLTAGPEQKVCLDWLQSNQSLGD